MKLQKNKTIGIDARFFGPKDKGLGRYSQNLIKNLEKIDGFGNNQYFVFLKKSRWDDYQPESSNFKKANYKDLRKYNIDLMHFTYFRIPFFYRGRFIVTIHDLITSHVWFLKRVAYRIILKLAIKKSEKIIAVSQCTKKEILKKFRIDPQKIEVIYEGVE